VNAPAGRSYIYVSPDMKGGCPVVSGRRLTAEHVAGMYWELGEHLQAEILDAYELTRSDVLIACWFQAEHGSRTWRRRWKDWLAATWSRTGLQTDPAKDGLGWWGDWSDVSLPPTKKESAA
jgi:uncharacterized protein (DUF433 family)